MAQRTELSLAGVPGGRHSFVAKVADIQETGEIAMSLRRRRVAGAEARRFVAAAVRRPMIARAIER